MRNKIMIAARLLLVAAVVLMALVGMGIPSAQAQLFPAYTSSLQVANLSSTSAAAITITAYNQDGSQNGSPLPDTIQAGSSKSYFPISNVSSGFNGSIVIGSNQNVAAISNIVTPDFKAGAAYVGRASGSTTVLLPILFSNNGGFYTWYSIQNAGSGDATVSIAYSDGVNAGPFTIKPGAAKVVYQQNETGHQKVFAGTITSNQPVVAAAIQENGKIMFAYTGVAGGDAAPVFPLINANNSGYQTGVQIQNAGTTATDVTVSYTPSSNGTACTETKTIPAGDSRTFAFYAFSATGVDPQPGTSNCAKGTPTGGPKFIGSARVTANSASQPLVAVVNQLGSTNGEAYNAFGQADAGDTVVAPLIMDRNSGFFTGMSVQNVGTGSTNVNCTFQNNSRTLSFSLASGQAYNDIQNGQLAPGYIGSATCKGDAGSKLVGVVNELKSSTVDNLLVYEGVKP